MKQPTKSARAAGGPTKMERADAGKHKPTGINKKVTKEKVPQEKASVRFGRPTQQQKL